MTGPGGNAANRLRAGDGGKPGPSEGPHDDCVHDAYTAVMSGSPSSGTLLPIHLWWPAIRPKTLSLAAAPVLVGAALAWRDQSSLDWRVLLVTLGTALAIQAGTNLFNDAKDGLRGDDGPDRIGPQRMTASGRATARQVLLSAWVLFAAALLGGIYLVLRGGTGILVLGLMTLGAGWAYSGGPRPLSHTAWGEAFVIAFFGLAAVCGTYFLQTGAITPAAALLGLALGAQAAAVLIVNNLRDLEADGRAGRRTLAGVLGRRGATLAYALFMLLPYPVIASALAAAQGAWGAFWLSLPVAVWLVIRFPRLTTGADMNRQLALTALAQLLLGILLTLNLLLSVA